MVQVSIVVPIYNVSAYLKRSLGSLVNQTYLDFDVLCVNDGSTDNSDSIIQEFVEKDRRFKRLDKINGGLSDARNYGLKYVESPYVMFLDSDDYYEPEMLKLAIQKMNDNQLDLLIFDYNQVFDETQYKEYIHLPFDESKIYDAKTDKELFAYVNNAAWNKLYRTELFKRNAIEYPFGYRHQDLGTTFRYMSYCNRVGFINKPLYNYLADRPNNITQQIDNKIDHILDMVDVNINFFKMQGTFELYYEELKYLSTINIFYSFRKLSQLKNKEFVFAYIDRAYKLLKSSFPDFPKFTYPIAEEPNSRIYLNKMKLKIYYLISRFRRLT